jgi:thiamine-monophosphate kinase
MSPVTDPTEFELIAAIRERLRDAGAPERAAGAILGSGDDAAVSVERGARATSVDAAVEGIHFRIPPFDHRQAGAKALATALSDLAAMGAAPAEAYVQLGLPPETGAGHCLELAAGIGSVAAEHGVVVAGGDLTRSPVLFVATTAIGTAASEADLVRRAGARAGDVVVLTGELGGAAAGLLLLERPELAAALEPDAANALRARQLAPRPRLEAGIALARAGASAMIDLSDGLGADAGHLAEASGVELCLRLDDVPRAQGVDPVAAAIGGDDYELLFTIAPERRAAAEAAAPVTWLGDVRAGHGLVLLGADGRPVEGLRGYEHGQG